MSWDTDLLNELIDDTFDVPMTEEEIMRLSTQAGFANPDDADDEEEDE